MKGAKMGRLYFGQYSEATGEIFVIDLYSMFSGEYPYQPEHYIRLFEEYTQGILEKKYVNNNKRLITYNGRIYYADEADHVWEFVTKMRNNI